MLTLLENFFKATKMSRGLVYVHTPQVEEAQKDLEVFKQQLVVS